MKSKVDEVQFCGKTAQCAEASADETGPRGQAELAAK